MNKLKMFLGVVVLIIGLGALFPLAGIAVDSNNGPGDSGPVDSEEMGVQLKYDQCICAGGGRGSSKGVWPPPNGFHFRWAM